MYHKEEDYRKLGVLYNISVRTKLYRQFKIFRGLVRTYLLQGAYSKYSPNEWWNHYYEGEIFDDSTTIEPGKSQLVTAYHYNSIENLILGYFVNHGRSLQGAQVLDVGSGAGHWLEFYEGIGAQSLAGVELSEVASVSLRKNFQTQRSFKFIIVAFLTQYSRLNSM